MASYKRNGVYLEFESLVIRFSFEEDYRNVSLLNFDLKQNIALFKLNDSASANYKPIITSDGDDIHSGGKVYPVGNGLNHGMYHRIPKGEHRLRRQHRAGKQTR